MNLHLEHEQQPSHLRAWRNKFRVAEYLELYAGHLAPLVRFGELLNAPCRQKTAALLVWVRVSRKRKEGNSQSGVQRKIGTAGTDEKSAEQAIQEVFKEQANIQ